MAGYLISFSIYTLAMIGVIFVALFVFKTFSNKCFSKRTNMLNVEDTMNLSPRKTLYVITAENERFLIASDVDRTTLIAKLGQKSEQPEEKLVKSTREDKSSKLSSFDGLESIQEFSSIIDFKKATPNKQPMMRELAKKLSTI